MQRGSLSQSGRSYNLNGQLYTVLRASLPAPYGLNRSPIHCHGCELSFTIALLARFASSISLTSWAMGTKSRLEQMRPHGAWGGGLQSTILLLSPFTAASTSSTKYCSILPQAPVKVSKHWNASLLLSQFGYGSLFLRRECNFARWFAETMLQHCRWSPKCDQRPIIWPSSVEKSPCILSIIRSYLQFITLQGSPMLLLTHYHACMTRASPSLYRSCSTLHC